VVVRLLQETQTADLSQLLQMSQNQALPLVLKKEAVYNAACVGQYVFYNHVDWNGWLHTTLLPVWVLRSGRFCLQLSRTVNVNVSSFKGSGHAMSNCFQQAHESL
jgi:hypothetical protein